MARRAAVWHHVRMHEWALAESVLESVRREAAGRRVTRVDLRFGELQQVDREIFAAALEALAPQASLDPSVFEVTADPAAFTCRRCGRTWKLAESGRLSPEEREAVHFLPETALVFDCCPGCGSTDFAITSGRGVSVAAIEVEDPGAGP